MLANVEERNIGWTNVTLRLMLTQFTGTGAATELVTNSKSFRDTFNKLETINYPEHFCQLGCKTSKLF